MDSLELFQKLHERISDHPASAVSVEWDDVVLCVRQELTIREVLFSPEHLCSMCGYLDTLAADLTNAAKFYDIEKIKNRLSELIGMLRTLPDLDEYEERNRQSLFDHAALRHFREDTTVLIGDSHVNFFSGNELIHYAPIGHDINLCPSDNRFSVLYYGSCLAYTCNKPDSSTGFSQKTDLLLKEFIRPGARIIVSLGEIDLRVHVFQQTVKQGREYRDIVDDIISNYLTFLRTLTGKGYNVYCWGPIASQKDDSPQDPAFPRIGTEILRNKATAYFNEKLFELCPNAGITPLSIFPQMITDDYRTREEYLSSDNFHLSQRAMQLAEPVLHSAGLLPG